MRAFIAIPALALALLTSPVRAQTPATLSAADSAAVFKAAGAVRKAGRWTVCVDDPSQPSARIETQGDLNGDRRMEVLVVEDGSFCHGATGTGYQLLSQQADGSWRLIAANSGIAQFLSSKGADGWPDISVGGPGFCFPVERWNGKAYVLNRFEYEGKACKPQR